MENKSLSSLLAVPHFGSAPEVYSAKSNSFHKANGISIYTSPTDLYYISGIELIKHSGEFLVDDELIQKAKQINHPDTPFGALKKFLCYGDRICIEKKTRSYSNLCILESKGFSVDQWNVDVENKEQEYIKSWYAWLVLNSFRNEIKGELNLSKENQLNKILELESIVKYKYAALRFRSDGDSLKNVSNCRYYIEKYLTTKDLKYLVEGYAV